MAATQTRPTTPASDASEDSPVRDVVRLSINLSTDVAQTLKSLAKAKDINITEAVRRAIAVWKFLEDETAKGNKIAVVETARGKETLREVVLL